MTDRTLVTEVGRPMGTPAYMSPEQWEGSQLDVDTRTDIYSLGVILYELLAGRVPFEGNCHAVVHQILNVAPPPPSAYRADVHPELEMVCLKAMAKRPEDRYDSMATLAAALDVVSFAVATLPPPPLDRRKLLLAAAGGAPEKAFTMAPKMPFCWARRC